MSGGQSEIIRSCIATAKNPYRLQTNGASHAPAIDFEIRHRWGPNRSAGIALHTAQYFLERCARQIVTGDGSTQGDCDGLLGHAATVQPVQLATPSFQATQLLVARRRFISNIVNRTAKGVKREHGLPPLSRQAAHGPKERSAGAPDQRFGGAIGSGYHSPARKPLSRQAILSQRPSTTRSASGSSQRRRTARR